MNVPIPIFSEGVSRSMLSEQLSSLPFKVPGVELREPHQGMGLSSDPGTMILLLDITKLIIPNLLTAIATIWAAKILVKSSPEASQGSVAVILHVDSVDGSTSSYELTDGGVLKLTFKSGALGEDPNQISCIRLEAARK